MADENDKKPLTAEEKQVLLVEYQVCQAHNNALSTEFWAVTAIMMSISVVLLGGVFYAVVSGNVYLNREIKTFISTLGLGMTFILGFVLLWLKRLQFMERVHQVRMREIENQLSLEKNWLVHGLDLSHKNKTNQIPNRLREKISTLGERFPSLKLWRNRQFFYRYEYPIGSQVVFLVFSAVILFWFLFILSIWIPVWISLLITVVLAVGIAIFIYRASLDIF